ncbi:MAG: hypothetical protein ABSF85_12380 [Terriglobales bacterium]
MRFLLVYHAQLSVAQNLVDDLDILESEIEIIPYHGENKPSASPEASKRFERLLKRLRGFSGAELALVGVKGKYRDALIRESASCGFSILHNFSSMLVAGQTLREWLAPAEGAASAVLLNPRAAFLSAAEQQPRLILAPGALDSADQLTELRFAFANRAATALSEYAARAGTRIGDLEVFFADRQVIYAKNGEHCVSYTVIADGHVVKRGSTEQHLKKGDHTTEQNAARVYFETVEVQGRSLVLVFYCGPHPSSSFEVRIDLTGAHLD